MNDNKIFVSQFHYGSIKTWRLNVFPKVPLCLNSTMVRLKQKEDCMKKYSWFLSQFHYGSIKTLQNKVYNAKTYNCLNSTMVRLKHYALQLV